MFCDHCKLPSVWQGGFCQQLCIWPGCRSPGKIRCRCSGTLENFSDFNIIIIIIFLDPGTLFPGCETLSKVCGVWNGYNGDSEIVKVFIIIIIIIII